MLLENENNSDQWIIQMLLCCLEYIVAENWYKLRNNISKQYGLTSFCSAFELQDFSDPAVLFYKDPTERCN